jgi:hypothetical protein
MFFRGLLSARVVLLGEYFQEVNYEIVMDGESTYYTKKHYDNYKNRGIFWQVIYFLMVKILILRMQHCQDGRGMGWRFFRA